MTQHDDVARLRHMLEHAREAVEVMRGRTRGDLDSNRMLSLALVRLLEIVGEASARVSKSTQAEQSAIPWPAIVGMRNRLIHGYDSVDHDVLWEIVSHDLPPLVTQLESLVARGTRTDT